MFSFQNDYSEGAHPLILAALGENNLIQAEGYGDDIVSEETKALLKMRIGHEDIDIHFFAGGTLCNLTAISSFLRPHEAVISAETGHIFTHETGSVEATGHKVYPVKTDQGKLIPSHIEAVVEEHHFEHMVKPKLVYISQPTEFGTLYSKKELTALRAICNNKNLLLFIDGARLGSALAAEGNDLSLSDLKELCDAFYIGATKNGALFGEALVICKDSLKSEFRYLMKQKGALLAKGRLLALQFQVLFRENLYFELGARANGLAGTLQSGIEEIGYQMQYHSRTSQIFPIFPVEIIERLEKEFKFYRWAMVDKKNWALRLICSWATKEEAVTSFLQFLKTISF